MSTRLTHVIVDANDPVRLSRFWADTLGWRIVIDDPHEVEIAGSDGDVPLIFVPVPEPKLTKNRIHFDLLTEQKSDTVKRLLALGGRHVDIGQRDVAWAVLADPEGNEFCVVPATDETETDLFGAIAHDAIDPFALGAFWRDATGWPVVIEGEFGVCLRSPSGGPYLTFGGGRERTAPKPRKNRLHLDVAPYLLDDHNAEVERLVALGAKRIDIGQGDVTWVVMADPEDNEFCVLTPR
jgi:predicted enzyme related to lactoylglutathione lyase